MSINETLGHFLKGALLDLIGHLGKYDPPFIVGKGYSAERFANAVVVWSGQRGIDFTDVNKDIWAMLAPRVRTLPASVENPNGSD